MESTSRVLQRKIMNIMNDGEKRDISDIKESLAVKEDFKYGEDYREGHLAGVLRVLVTNKDLEKEERGVYRLNELTHGPVIEDILNMDIDLEPDNRGMSCLEEMKQETLTVLERQYHSLVGRMDAVSLSSLSPSDFESVRQLSELKEDLKQILLKYGRASA